MRVLVVGVLTLAVAGQAYAQMPEAQELFERGRKQAKDGDYEAACKSFEASLKLQHAMGTLYNLGLCHEKLGKIASAWAELKQVVTGDSNKPRVADAAKHVADLEPRLTRFKLVVAEPVAGLTIEREGIDMTGLVGQSVVVDPRTYKFTASAPGYTVATVDAALDKEGETIDVTIPALKKTTTSTPDAPIKGYPTQLALRPVTIPDGRAEMFAGTVAATSAQLFEHNPIDTVVGARYGIQKFEVALSTAVRLRQAQVTTEPPNRWTQITGSVAYAIQRNFAGVVQYSRVHPVGDLDNGSDLRVFAARRQLLQPRIAFDGTAGFAFQQRERGGAGVSELVLEANLGLIATATPKLSLGLGTEIDLNAGGELFDHTIGLGAVPLVLYAAKPNVDVFARAFLGLLPAINGNSSDLRVYVIGVNWRP